MPPTPGNPLIDGEIVGADLVCVYHRWRFDLATGARLAGDVPARTFAVEIRGSIAWIELGEDD